MVRKRNVNSALTRRQLLKYGFYGGLSASLAPSLWITGCAKRPHKKLNHLIISIDTLRADHVSCYGYKKVTTPNIDQLAQQGHRFSNAYTTMPTTLPAHASLFSSLYPTQLSTRRYSEKIPTGATMLAEILQSAGYTTAAFVSAIVMNARFGLNKGFQTYDDVSQLIERTAVETLTRTTAWLANQTDEPFFLFIHFYDPHTYYYAPEVFRRRLGAPNRSTPPAFQFVLDTGLFTAELVRETIAAYDAEIAYADWAVGQLIRELDERGLGERTLVVLMSDHGETLDELIDRYGYAFDHGEFLYAHQLQIPMIVRMPGMLSQKEGIVHTDPVSIVDIMPTVLDALHMDLPESMMGRSLLPMLRGEETPGRLVFSERRTFQKVPKPYLAGNDCSIIENEWHLIFSTIRDCELYNLHDDPGEISNLLHESERANTLKSKIQKWIEQTKPLYGPSTFETDKETLKRLRSLGYIE